MITATVPTKAVGMGKDESHIFFGVGVRINVLAGQCECSLMPRPILQRIRGCSVSSSSKSMSMLEKSVVAF